MKNEHLFGDFPVLIPLLVDDPLWEIEELDNFERDAVLIPLLVDDPLWGGAN